MKLETIPASQLTTEECNKLRSLTLRKEGQLAYLLSDWRYYDVARVVRMTDDDGRIIAWGMVVPYDSRHNKDVQLYVRKSERRKGYGREVYKRLMNSAGGRQAMIVHPHSEDSIEFFNAVHYGPANLPLTASPF